MLPFILLPVGIVNVEQEQKTVTARIQPENIDYYYPGFHSGTVIVNKSGNSLLTTMLPEQFDAVLVEYDKQRKSKTGKFGILKIN